MVKAGKRGRKVEQNQTVFLFLGPAIKGGKINFRVDKQSNLHFVIGKASFDDTKLVENYGAALDEILRAKLSSAKETSASPCATSTRSGSNCVHGTLACCR